MAKLKVPILVIVIGEGSSGGALAIAVGNRVIMLENAIYSILSPEGYASILWKDSSRAKEAAEKMKLTAKDLYELNIIDKIIEEPIIEDKKEFILDISNKLKNEILEFTASMKNKSVDEIVNERYNKFRNMGRFEIL